MKTFTYKCKLASTFACFIVARSTSVATLRFIDRIDVTTNDTPELDFFAFSVTSAGDLNFIVDGFGAGVGTDSLFGFALLSLIYRKSRAS